MSAKTQEPVVVCSCGKMLIPHEKNENTYRYKCECGKKYKLIKK